MTKRLEVVACESCGAMMEMLKDCPCEPCSITCCGKDVTVLQANAVDAATEKHVPVIEKTGAGIKVTVGSVPHPMEDKHYIEWIELLGDGKSYRQFLRPGQLPQAMFPVVADEVSAREHCNLHGLWKA